MLRRFDPWRDFLGLRDEIDRLFDRFSATPETFKWSPSIDVYEDNNHLVVKAELPGMKSKDVDITVTNNRVTIKGEKRKDEEVKGENYYRKEAIYGTFQRTIPLPYKIKEEDVDATFKNGILEIRMPKAEKETKGVKIKVKEE